MTTVDKGLIIITCLLVAAILFAVGGYHMEQAKFIDAGYVQKVVAHGTQVIWVKPCRKPLIGMLEKRPMLEKSELL